MRSVLPLLVLFPVCAVAQNATINSPGIQSLQQKLTASPGTVTLVAPELRLAQIGHADVRVENGKIHLRMANSILAVDSDDIVHANDVLLVRKVEGTSEKKNDYLRITVGLSDGKSAPVAFELPKDALKAMDEPALEKLMAPIFVSGGSLAMGAGADTAVAAPQPAAPPPPPETHMAPIAPPPPPPDEPAAPAAGAAGSGNGSWRVSDVPGGHEAMVAGTLNSGGKSGSAVFGILCGVPQGVSADFAGAGKTQLVLELRAHKEDVVLTNPLYCDPHMNTGGVVTLEGKAAEHAKVCNSTKDPAGALVSYQMMLPDRSVRDIAAGMGKSVTVRLGGSKPDEVVARFDLPMDGAALKPIVAACPAGVAARPAAKR